MITCDMVNSNHRRMNPIHLTMLAGIFIGTSYIPFPPWAIFFCFTPLWLAWLRSYSYREIFWTGWLCQFVLTFIGFNWVAHTVHEFGHLPWPLAILTLMAFCSFANLHIPLVGLFWYFLTKRLRFSETQKIWTLPLLMALGERTFPMIFDWHFGYTWLWAGFPAVQFADVVGFLGLSSFGLLANGLALAAWEKKVHFRWLVGALVLFLGLNFAGWWYGNRDLGLDRSLRVLVTQANIGNQEKMMAEQGLNFRNQVINKFISLTSHALSEADGPVDFAVWPETAFPEIIDTPDLLGTYPDKLKRFILEKQTPLITGGYSQLNPGRSNNQITNSFFALDATGRWAAPPYHKTILLAFGEFLPLAETFPWIKKYAPQEIGDFGRGPGPTVLELSLRSGKLHVGAQICYEGLFDWFSVGLAKKGAQILVNLTNDSWYGTWQQPYQHGYMTLSRALETRRPLVRATNTGLTAAILANGEILTISPLAQEWTQVFHIPYASHGSETFFVRMGHWLIPSLLVFALLTVCSSAIISQSRNTNDRSVRRDK